MSYTKFVVINVSNDGVKFRGRASLVKAPDGAFYLLATLLAKIRRPESSTGCPGIVDLYVGRWPIFYIPETGSGWKDE